ncbi:dynactin subunit 2-like [Oscarella lobularis]|uniref:dynactin subunit 2-like n=1 Tax=Oscarella lobularis TaxID=121494 RepID=UPI0033138F68
MEVLLVHKLLKRHDSRLRRVRGLRKNIRAFVDMAEILESEVFETPDPVRGDDHYEDDSVSETVEGIEVDVQASHDMFNKSVLDSRQANFSDAVGRSRSRGYGTKRSEFELLPDGDKQKESLYQKYQRLKLETEDLLKDLKDAKEVEETAKNLDVSTVNLANQAGQLHEQLNEFTLEKVLGQMPGQSAADRELSRRLNAELKSFREKAPTTGGDGHVTYELYYRPEHEKFAQLSKVAELEQRVKTLEAAVGTKESEITFFSHEGHPESKSLTTAAEALEEKLSLLDLDQIDQIEARLQSVLYHMSQIAANKESVEKVEEVSKVDELYELVKNWDHMASSLPQLVSRLESLQELHRQAAEFSQSVTYLDAAQQRIKSQLESDRSVMASVTATFEKNSLSIVANCEALEQRIGALLANVNPSNK